MARATTKTKPGTAVANWEEELAEQAEVAAGQQRTSSGGGAFVSTRAGQLSFDGADFPGNQMAAVVIASVLENSYYSEAFDPDKPASPRCFAFGINENTMEPHEAVDAEVYFERQHDECSGCPQNEWGSAAVGRGKACKNVVRLALLPAGVYKALGGRNSGLELTLFEDPEHFKAAGVAYLKLPVMSVKGWTQYVKSLASDIRRPPHGVVTNIVVVPDQKSQYKVEFELLEQLGPDLLSVLMPRHKKEQEAIGFPYTPPPEDEAPVANKANNKLKRPAAKR